MFSRAIFLSGASLLGLAAGVLPASATPYAFSSNQITGIAIQGVTPSNGGVVQPLNATGTSAIGNSSAGYGSSSGTSLSASGTVGSTVDVPEATSGAGPFPGQNVYTNNAGETGGMVGARSDSLITAGVAGSVSASNVAEAFGNQVGSSTGKNTAAITFTVAAGTTEAVRISFSDSIYLEAASSALVGENANATIKNDFTIRQGSANGAIVFSFTPTGNASTDAIGGTTTSDPFNANASTNSLQNQPPDGITSANGTFAAQSNQLAAGTYVISVDSAALVSITPGTPVPEPSGFAILGVGLAALAGVRFRRSI